MDVVLLAAGRGARLMPLTENQPKSLVTLPDGRMLIDVLIDFYRGMAGIERLIVVSGYRADALAGHLTQDKSGQLLVVENPAYAELGAVGSFLAGVSASNATQLIIANADTICGEDFRQSLHAAAREDRDGLRLLGSADNGDDDAVRVRVGSNDRIERIGKALPDATQHPVSTGVLIATGYGSIATLRSAAQSMVLRRRSGLCTAIWHSILDRLIDSGVAIEAWRVPSASWFEIDTTADLTNPMVQALLEKQPAAADQ